MGLEGDVLSLTLEHDDGWEEVEVALPALLSVAERLCEPSKVPPPQRAEVPADRIRLVTAAELGDGPWGQAGSPTRVGRTRVMHHDRLPRSSAARRRNRRPRRWHCWPSGARWRQFRSTPMRAAVGPMRRIRDGPGVIAVLVEPDRPQVGAELLGAASELAASIGGRVHALAFEGADTGVVGCSRSGRRHDVHRRARRRRCGSRR